MIEYVFNYPGIGSELVDAVVNHDIPVVQALAILIAGLYVAAQPARRHGHDPGHAPTEDPAMSDREVELSRDQALALAEGSTPRPVGTQFEPHPPFVATGRTRIGLVLVGILVLIAVFGPLVAPHASDAVRRQAVLTARQRRDPRHGLPRPGRVEQVPVAAA